MFSSAYFQALSTWVSSVQLAPPYRELRGEQRGEVPLHERKHENVAHWSDGGDEDDEERHERQDVQSRAPHRQPGAYIRSPFSST